MTDSTPAPMKPWPYTVLDPTTVAQSAYRYLDEGGCMYAVVAAIVRSLAEKMGEPHDRFPLAMMTYGRGGLGGYGSLCGAINGATAVIGLYCPADRQGKLIRRLLRWFAETELPVYSPAGTTEDADTAHETPSNIGETVDCHPSLARWREAVGRKVTGEERKIRCKRLSADTAAKVVELLNEELT